MDHTAGPGAAALLECVPNVSEGRDPAAIDGMAAAVRGVAGVALADVHADPDHHRSVFTILGPPEAVVAAALALAGAALDAIDMRRHRGVHPRIGALDVCPFVPLGGAPMALAVAAARRFGQALAAGRGVPVYFYGEAAAAAGRRALPAIRAGGYEGLAARLGDPAWAPDAGPARFDARAGATAVGARPVLVAYNVWLDADDLGTARAIAASVRESSGGLPALQAMGVRLESRRCAQVAMNLLDYRRTSLARAFDAVAAEAARRGVGVARGELVGLAPRAALGGRPPETVGLPGLAPERYLDTWLARLAPGAGA
jgi:glutamate formiminotransferase